VAEHAAGPLGAARIAARLPDTNADAIRDALAQVAELAALLITDESIRAEPVPDIAQSLELLRVEGSALEAPAFAEMTVALAAMRVVAADLKRLGTAHGAQRTLLLRVDPPAKELETKLVQSISPDGQVLDSASKDLARARQRVREARKHVMDKLGAILGSLDQTERAPDAAVTVRGGRYVIPIRSTARARVGGIVHDESATRSTVFVEPPEIIELGNELRAAESAEHADAALPSIRHGHLERGMVGVRDEDERPLRRSARCARLHLPVAVGRRREGKPRELAPNGVECGELVIGRGRGRSDAPHDLERAIGIG